MGCTPVAPRFLDDDKIAYDNDDKTHKNEESEGDGIRAR
jgi:hypothetical protein